MANMSYCRFENTLGDVLDCKEALQERGGVEGLSDRERRCALELVSECRDIAAQFGFLLDGHEEDQ